MPVLLATITLAMLLAGGCDRSETTLVYAVPKGSERIAPETSAAPHGHNAPDHNHSDRPWRAPAEWRESPDNPVMRVAIYVIEDPTGPVEVTITRFPGDVGGVHANVNRWRGQIGLGAVEPAAIDDLTEPFGGAAWSGYFVELHGAERSMLAAGIYEAAADHTWFVRVVTDRDTAARLKPQVKEFAKSFGAEDRP